ncbi:hypothetical protein RB195_012192 [Necator americanus]|uniref:WAP domain-containing protein n=1 Tax=Necator americanus TaxID=51031 RepID=A0ABR1D6R3_NECAM
MFRLVFRLLLLGVLLPTVFLGNPCNECIPRAPSHCCSGKSGRCCDFRTMVRKKRGADEYQYFSSRGRGRKFPQNRNNLSESTEINDRSSSSPEKSISMDTASDRSS